MSIDCISIKDGVHTLRFPAIDPDALSDDATAEQAFRWLCRQVGTGEFVLFATSISGYQSSVDGQIRVGPSTTDISINGRGKCESISPAVAARAAFEAWQRGQGEL